MFHLFVTPWIPVRMNEGSRKWITVGDLSHPDIVCFDAARADFNAALMQFAIGLLQTCTPVETAAAWRKLLATPPDAATLSEWFAPVAEAFKLDGDGPRFMQDLALEADSPVLNPIAALLIESPGENALRNNSDHFVKRGRIEALCPTCAATALLTLQINAPSGGVGYRTGLRGGGPLTTLLVQQTPRSLWHDLWLNVLERPVHLSHCGNAERSGVQFRFPWMGAIGTLQTGENLSPLEVHPDHVFWATPRRIRLDFSNTRSGSCDVCERASENLIHQFFAKNYGLNYKGGWRHPLSPYYEVKNEWLPLHPQPGGIGYQHWLAWVLGVSDPKSRQSPARVVSWALESRRRHLGGPLRLWAFGYDMDNMKPRCWYESKLPLYRLGDSPDATKLETVAAMVATWLNGARQAALYLRNAVKDAWFARDARGSFNAVDDEFWHRTESAFYFQLRQCIDLLAADDEADPDTLQSRRAWHSMLRRTALDLFEHSFVGSGPIERQNPQRIAVAYRQLRANLGGKKIHEILRLPRAEQPSSAISEAAPPLAQTEV